MAAPETELALFDTTSRADVRPEVRPFGEIPEPIEVRGLDNASLTEQDHKYFQEAGVLANSFHRYPIETLDEASRVEQLNRLSDVLKQASDLEAELHNIQGKPLEGPPSQLINDLADRIATEVTRDAARKGTAQTPRLTQARSRKTGEARWDAQEKMPALLLVRHYNDIVTETFNRLTQRQIELTPKES